MVQVEARQFHTSSSASYACNPIVHLVHHKSTGPRNTHYNPEKTAKTTESDDHTEQRYKQNDEGSAKHNKLGIHNVGREYDAV